MSLYLARLAYAVAAVVLITGYYLASALRPAAVAATGLLSVAAIGFGLARFRPQRWGAWLLIATAVVLISVGDVIYTLADAGTPDQPPYPAAQDMFYLAMYLPLAIGVLWLGQARLPSRDWPMILDTAALTLAGSLVVWIALVRPAVTSLHLVGAGLIVAIASWVGYVAVLAASARVLLAWRRNLALGLIAAAVATFLVADFFYGWALIRGTWATGSAVDLGYLAFSLLCGSAALTASMSRASSSAYARHRLGPGRLALLAVALLVAPTALLVQATSGSVTTGAAIAVVMAAVGTLILARLWLGSRQYARRVGRELAARKASRALVIATTDGEVVAGIRAGLLDMLPPASPGEVLLRERLPLTRAGSTLLPTNGDRVSHAMMGALTVPLPDGAPPTGAHHGRLALTRPARQDLVFVAPMAQLVELSPVMETLGDQAALALHRIWLADHLHAEQRERYFRTLVQTSDDVTLISRDGRVVYATPSAQSMFGRDIVGERFDDLIHHERAGEDGGQRNGVEQSWPDTVEDVDGHVEGAGGAVDVLVRRRDLTQDPTVGGVVTTLRDVSAERALQRDLAYRASHDPLTGLANTRLFNDQLAQDLQRRRNNPATADGTAVLIIDLDDFKTVNDTHGHELGDRLLIEVAQRIKSRVRVGDLAARLGGDEFAVLLADLADIDAARDVAQRIADALARPARLDAITVDCQASIGLSYARASADAESLLREADVALYAAKARGKGHWRQYREGMLAPARRHITERRRLEDALHDGSLTVHYQPIVDLATGVAVGFEALLRLPDPPVPTEELIRTAEDTGLIIAVGDWVLRRALTDVAALNPPQVPRPRYVSVNISARQLRQPDFADTVRNHLAACSADPRLLVLEITENLMVDDDRGWDLLTGLRHDGIRIAIDDFGTGFSSLNYLRRPGIDIVKIDRSFLTDVDSEPGRILLQTVTYPCTKLGLDQIAEGIEDNAARQAALTAGCCYGQGFHFAPAMPLAQASRWAKVLQGAAA